ncbi:hypothetical protein IFM89_002060 [Coptis chinensis]|uniref:Uncharacterized protein n=1 Tax=Coptis chinensis TaxID=261450 RepID=A0A835I2G2_9MAGN|nr:hypothetical protein IFM89_002060 [Coptis chinensis]
MKQIGSAPIEDSCQKKSGIRVGRTKPLIDPPIIKHKGRPGRKKSWVDNIGKKTSSVKPKQAKTAKKVTSDRESPSGSKSNDMPIGKPKRRKKVSQNVNDSATATNNQLETSM